LIVIQLQVTLGLDHHHGIHQILQFGGRDTSLPSRRRLPSGARAQASCSLRRRTLASGRLRACRDGKRASQCAHRDNRYRGNRGAPAEPSTSERLHDYEIRLAPDCDSSSWSSR
jgi:hypothetical protein